MPAGCSDDGEQRAFLVPTAILFFEVLLAKKAEILGPSPELKKDRSSAKAIAKYDRALAALDPPNRVFPVAPRGPR